MFLYFIYYKQEILKFVENTSLFYCGKNTTYLKFYTKNKQI